MIQKQNGGYATDIAWVLGIIGVLIIIGEVVALPFGGHMIQKRSYSWTAIWLIILGIICWLISKAWVIINTL